MSTELAAMEERARVWQPALLYCGNVADFATSEVLRALRECAKLMCPRCAYNRYPATLHKDTYRHSEYMPCHAGPLHAKIAQLESL